MDTNRILWLTENYPPQRGGMAQSCDRIVDGLRKNGYQIDVLHFCNRGQAFQTVQQVQGSYTSLPVDESESHTLNVAWNFIQHQSAKALVCFGGYLPVLAAPVFSKWLSLPLITLLRGNDFDSAIFTPRKRDLLRDAILASQHVCVVSSDKVEKIEKLFPGPTISYIPNGIDVSPWHATPSEKDFAKEWKSKNSNGKVCIGIFGQLKAKKGVDFFVKSLAGLSLKAQAHLLLVGELSEEVLDLVSQSTISYAHYPFMDRYELIKYYLCCDAIAIPSHYDGMPNVLLEAGALGIPVIASRTGGMLDVLAGTETNLLFDPGHTESCKTAISLVFNATSEQRKAWGDKVKREIENNFNHSLETKRYEKVIDDIMHTSSSNTLRVQSR
jgi:glycogen(starch) synthase